MVHGPPFNHRFLKMVLKYDLYTREYIRPDRRSIEHVIPNRLLSTTKAKKDCRNLFVVHGHTNHFRSDFRFGGSIEEIIENRKDWEHLQYNVFRNRKKRIFFPMYGRKIIANVCVDMFRAYPELHDYQKEIMVTEDTKEWFYERVDDTDKFILFLKSRFKS